MDFFTFIAIIIVGGPIAGAIAKRISGHSGRGEAALREELELTEQRLEDAERQLAYTADRLAEVEERLDFAERLLAQHKATDRLGP